MAGMGAGIAGDHWPQIGIADPVEQPRAQDARAQPALAGDHQHAARAGGAFMQDEFDQLAMSGVLRVAVKIEPRVDLRLSAANPALVREIFRRA